MTLLRPEPSDLKGPLIGQRTVPVGRAMPVWRAVPVWCAVHE
jgi:hypothetical protein